MSVYSDETCDRCGQLTNGEVGVDRHWHTREGYKVCEDLVRPDARGEPEWDIKVVLEENKDLLHKLHGIAQVMKTLRTDPGYHPPGNSLKTIYSIERSALEAVGNPQA